MTKEKKRKNDNNVPDATRKFMTTIIEHAKKYHHLVIGEERSNKKTDKN